MIDISTVRSDHRPREVEESSDLLFPDGRSTVQYSSTEFTREIFQCSRSYSQLVDAHARHRAKIFYLRLSSSARTGRTSIVSRGKIARVVHSSHAGVLVGVVDDGVRYTVWLPLSPTLFRADDHGRIKVSDGRHTSCELSFYPRIRLTISAGGDAGEEVVFPYVVLEDPAGDCFDELFSSNDFETRLYRKSDWFFASAPTHVWNYLINGNVYDPRTWPGVGKRFRCQQCALAWWSYFEFLRTKTGKRVYGLMRDEIAYSVLLDLSPEGEWGHGFWSDEIETHARFHLDGIHLLLSQYENTNDPRWLEAAERGMGFVFAKLVDRFEDGSPWFLHDTREIRQTHRIKSRIFGKSAGNSLCLNTHVQALTVLHRLSVLAQGKPIYGEELVAGAAALHAVLRHQPGEAFYTLLSFMLEKCYHGQDHKNAVWPRVKNAIRWRITRMLYWRLKNVAPRLVLPDGFIERDLTLSAAADDYHNTNLKDLLTLYQQKPYPWLRTYIANGLRFQRKLIQTLGGLSHAVERSPYYFEYMDILHLYDRLIERLPDEEIASTEDALYRATGAYSLDFYASHLVRPPTA